MGPGGPGGRWPLAGTVLVAVAASLAAGDEDCLWYVDRNGSWHPGFDCNFFTFCCGTCHQRYCCRDPLRLITERQQRHCLAFSPKTIAGIASAVVLFIAIVTTIVCCFMCSCCYLYQRRQHLRTPCKAPRSPGQLPHTPPAPFPVDPKAGPCPPSLASPPWPCTRRSAPPPSTRCTPPDPPSTTPQHHRPTSPHSPATPAPEPPGGPRFYW
nr:protein shisa-4 isoform X1 [Anas platyrhynchos]